MLIAGVAAGLVSACSGKVFEDLKLDNSLSLGSGRLTVKLPPGYFFNTPADYIFKSKVNVDPFFLLTVAESLTPGKIKIQAVIGDYPYLRHIKDQWIVAVEQ